MRLQANSAEGFVETGGKLHLAASAGPTSRRSSRSRYKASRESIGFSVRVTVVSLANRHEFPTQRCGVRNKCKSTRRRRRERKRSLWLLLVLADANRVFSLFFTSKGNVRIATYSQFDKRRRGHSSSVTGWERRPGTGTHQARRTGKVSTRTTRSLMFVKKGWRVTRSRLIVKNRTMI